MAGSAADGCRYAYDIIRTDPGLAVWRCEVHAVKTTTNNLNELHGIVNVNFEIDSSEMHRRAAPEPLDTASVEWLQLQLQKCDDGCDHGYSELPFLPTRLIHVGQNEDDAPRLVIVENMLDSGVVDALQYATLSYCWGSKEDALKQTKTTKDTITTHLQGIPTSSLSPVVRDTIKACRALGISYLWVDALCIIQDGNVDWDRESQMMGQIYHSCYVTICPLSSRSCLEGYLGLRPQGLEVEFQSSRHEHIKGIYRLVRSPTDADEYDGQNEAALGRDLKRSSWHNRGWTFQESMLSPRMILFGPNMSHFICEIQLTSENGSIDSNMIYGKLQVMIRRAFGKPSKQPERSATTKMGVYGNWCAVHEVSKRAWTYPEDILPGLAGIAQAFATLTGDTYLAGLWKDDLHIQLLWYMLRPPAGELASVVHSLQHTDPYVTPSWSWASQKEYQEDLIGREISMYDDEVVKGNWVRSYSSKRMPRHNRPDFALLDYCYEL
ncbi:hypothetical protein CCUS01_11400 [Colletotrichum cuscutae]|uniref:Heterokaryon incompatibility domain-containing protein n=1 Tax=Colletotrichum cuscutae TaxID=1209917 RepID=A0AAI9XK36_9PEZI|nr:hypothetical protein CCUS01_11400 [Colletotrichum cuscutae]